MFFRKLTLIFLAVVFTSSHGQSISSEYNSTRSDNSSNQIKNYIKNNLNTSNSNYLCSDALQSKVISLSESEITSKKFISGLVDNNPPYIGKFSRSGNIITWEECIPILCSSMSSKNELQLSSDKRIGNLFEKTILSGYSTINKFKCNTIDNQSPQTSPKTSDIEERLRDLCNKGDGKYCMGLGMFLSEKMDESSPEVIFYYKKSCSLNYAGGCVYAGMIVSSGNNPTSANLNEGISLLKKSCNLNFAEGCVYAGLKLTTLKNLTPRDYSNGMLLLKKSCSMNQSKGCYYAGLMPLLKVLEKKTTAELSKEEIIEFKESKLMLEKACKSNYENSCEKLKDITRIINDYS